MAITTSAYYPTTVADFGNDRTDNVNTVIASDVNRAYAEILAIENTIGFSPLTDYGWNGTFDVAKTVFASINDRIKNIEAGLKLSYNGRVSSTGGTILIPSVGNFGLAIQASVGTSANLFEVRNSSGVAGAAFGPNGNIVTIDGGTA